VGLTLARGAFFAFVVDAFFVVFFFAIATCGYRRATLPHGTIR
jgi:hypothetical protein